LNKTKSHKKTISNKISVITDIYSALFEETDKELVQGLVKLQQEVI